MKRFGAVLILVALALLAVPAAASADSTDVRVGYIVRLDSRSDIAGRTSLARSLGGEVTHEYRNVFAGYAADLPLQAVSALLRRPSVRWIERDGVVNLSATESPTPSWGLDRIDQHPLPLDSSYTYGTNGAGV